MNTKKKAALIAMCIVLGGLCCIAAIALGVVYHPLITLGAIAFVEIIKLIRLLYKDIMRNSL